MVCIKARRLGGKDLKAISGFKLNTEPFERWLRGCGSKDLERYYYKECDTKKQNILDNLYHEYKRLNIPDTRCVILFSVGEDRKFVLDKDKKKDKKIRDLAKMQEEKDKEKIKING